MAKSLLKKAKKAAKTVVHKSHVNDPHAIAAARVKKLQEIRAHIEKLSADRRDCASIWTLIKHDSSKYKTDEEILALIKAKGYETLLGEIS
jgi:hypothetical protein